MATDNSIIQDFNTFYQDAYTAWSPFYGLAERDLRFFLGDQWSQTEKQKLFNENRNAFVFNKIKRVINMVTGYQRKNRLSSVVVPVEDSDQKTADQFTALLLSVMNQADGYQAISDAFGGALKTGWNMLSVYVDYRDDLVNGDIKYERLPYNSFITDPYISKLDLSDCGYIIMRKYLSSDQVESMLPDRKKEIQSLQKIGWSRDDKFNWLPYQRMPTGYDLMAYNEMYQQKWKNVPVLVDMETGEMTEFDMDKNTIKEFITLYPQLKVVKKAKKYIEKHIIVNDQYIKTEINPYGLDEYPFVPFVSTFEPESDQWDLKVQSLVRSMVDPQVESNRRRSQMVDILDSQLNSGWVAKENSVINPQSLFQSSQGKVIWKKEDAPPDSLERLQPSQIPPSMFQLQELYDRDIVDIAGVNDAAFGITEQAGDSGVMMLLRQGAAITNLQDLFDNLRNSQKQLSRKTIKIIQSWTPSKIKRIINDEPTEQFYSKDFAKYDVAVQEGILTDTQKQMYFRQLVDLKNLGVPVTGEMLAEAAPLQGKSKYIEQLAASEQQQAQAAQEQQQVQNQLLDSQRQMAQAKAISDLALSKERYTRAVANNSLADERSAKAVEDRASSAFERIKAVKELQTIDDDRFMKYLSIIKMMEEVSKKDELEIKKDDVAIASSGQEIGDQLTGIPQQNLGGQPPNTEQELDNQGVQI